MAFDKHGRDPGISEIVRYFDQPERNAWHLLTDKEAAVLHDEIRKCSDPDSGFPYTARNYYWLTTKDGSDTLLRFKETQEMLWETVRYLRLRGAGVKIIIVKARQLFISSFCEGYLAWLTQFNPNNRGLLVSYNEDHAAILFGMILHIYDHLPWWLRPMIGSRKYEEGIHLINPDPELRYLEPGLNSRIIVQGATQNVGIAEGSTINSAHLSEWGSWDEAKARKIIMGDFRWGLPDSPSTTAILETRIQKNSQFAERLWEKMVENGEDADWYPFFIPIYFDKSHFIAPRAGWKPEKPEIAVKERAAAEWCTCPQCGQIRPALFGGAPLVGIPCRDCKTTAYSPYVLQDGQMLYLQRMRMNVVSENDLVLMQQSLATNPQEAFASVTDTIFSKEARAYVATTTRRDCLATGYMASDGVFHAPRAHHGPDGKRQEGSQCWAQGCKQDHSGETSRYLKIWTPPMRGVKYWASADPSHGKGGSGDYAVINVFKNGHIPEPDIQVACYRCNTIDAYHFADVANALGRWYNNALMIVDYTNLQTTGDRLRIDLKYPNIYRWVLPDALAQTTNRFHWVWNSKNKESACQTLDAWLKDHSIVVQDPVFAKELRHFQRMADGSLGAPSSKDGAGDDFEKLHDDTVTSVMAGVVAAHQKDPRRPTADNPLLAVPQENGVRSPGTWRGLCTKCDKGFPAQAPCERDRCPFCGSHWLRWKMVEEQGPALGFNFDDMGGTPGVIRDRQGASEEFSFGSGGLQNGSFGS